MNSVLDLFIGTAAAQDAAAPAAGGAGITWLLPVMLIVVSTLRQASSAHMLEPLPRWATTTFPLASRGETPGNRLAI